MTEDLEKRREEAAQAVDKYVRAALSVCKTVEEINTFLMVCGMQMGVAMAELYQKERA